MTDCSSIKGGFLMNEFQLYFQPKVDMQDNRIIGYEILLRNNEANPFYPAQRMEEIIYNKEEHSLYLNWFQKNWNNWCSHFPQ